MTGPARAAGGGRIDRSRLLSFAFDGREYAGHPGDTLASALLANGVRTVARSVRHGRPRGIYGAGAEDPGALVRIASGPAAFPMRRATQVELYDGLRARGLTGRGVLLPEAADTVPGGFDPAEGVSHPAGRIATTDDEARYDRAYLHCDVLVVGGGPAGIAAAWAAGDTGARVVLLDEGPELGGGLLGSRSGPQPAASGVHREGWAAWVAEAAETLAAFAETRVMTRTAVVGYYDHNLVVAAQRRAEHLGFAAPRDVSVQRLWHIRSREVVLATGAHERPIVFCDNDRPGVMLASAARTYLNRYGVMPGTRAVVFTANDSAYHSAIDLADAGVELAAVVDVRPRGHATVGPAPALLRERGVDVLWEHVVSGTDGPGELAAARIARADRTEAAVVDCDVLAVSGGWNPAVHLFSQSGGRLRYDEERAAFVPADAPGACLTAGAVHGVYGTAAAVADGLDAGAEAARRTGFAAVRGRAGRPGPGRGSTGAAHDDPSGALGGVAYWAVPAANAEERTRQFVDLERDVSVAEVERAAGTGMRALEHIKRYTTVGTGSDQGKTSQVLATGVVAELLGRPVTDTGTTTFRPPYLPVPFGLLAGRDRGELADPVRVTALHDWHEAHGAVFEDVGQWKRPRYYPRPGEDFAAAVARECRAARRAVAVMDASTLGKIDLQGPDTAEFLDRVYTNLMSTLRVGSCRYGMLCTADGMVFDDGVVARLADDHFLASTTTGNAAAVLDHFEEWLQTEWPELRVFCTSVTDHWATVAVVGPRSRDVIAALAPDLPVDAGSFPFMTARDAVLRVARDSGGTGAGSRGPAGSRGSAGSAGSDEDAGLGARIFRISFSGELAYEVNVPAWHARALWEAVMAAGEPYGITPYGTETMHVLRAEKGYPIVGQETDGTVTPQDLGMGWIVSSKKPDFVGRRSHARADTARRDRMRLVGLLPVDPDEVLPEGAQLVADRAAMDAETPVPMVGHVTSSYHSATLERSIALALVRGGTDRLGERLYAPLEDRTVPVTVTEPVFYDLEGRRRDG